MAPLGEALGGEAGLFVVAQRGQGLDQGVVPVPAGWDDAGLQGEPVDQLLNPDAKLRPGRAGLIWEQRGPVRRPAQVAEPSGEGVPQQCHRHRLPRQRLVGLGAGPLDDLFQPPARTL
jgi:hypothetical protein